LNKEPRRLIKGKNFHKKIQKEWIQTADGDIQVEKTINKPSGRSGRIDVFAESDDNLVAVLEIKASDWDKMSEKNLKRNVRRQIRQVWNYIDSQLSQNKDVSPGIVFPKRPVTPGRLQMIEDLFIEEGIPVVWEDESIDERKARG